MSDDQDTLRRRTVLKTTSGTLASAGLVGTGTAGGKGESLERFNVGFANSDGRDVLHDNATTVVREFGFGAATVEISAQNVKSVEKNENIRYFESDGEMHAVDDYYPWGIERVDADVAHEAGETGANADVTIVDTGIEPSHSDLAENIGTGECFVSCSDGCETCWDDDNGHGTHIAGTVAAAQNGDGVIGIGPEITLHAAKALNSNGAGTASDIAAAIEWAADQNHDVTNLSIGGDYSALIHDACQHAYESGVLLAAAAGNEGCYDCVTYPAALNEVIAVSATTTNDELADFSSYGSEIELAAPGTDIVSTYVDDSYAELSGTSTAAPHVSGAGAHLMANGYTNTEARDRLQDTAEDIGLAPYEQGHGLVDVAAALGLSD